MQTINLYTFDELTPAAQAAAVENFARDNQWIFGDLFRDCEEYDIWECVRDLEKQTHCKWSYDRWYSCDFDIEYNNYLESEPYVMEPVKDNGYCYSMDMVDAWNAHIEELNRIAREWQRVVDDVYDNAPLCCYDDSGIIRDRLEAYGGQLVDAFNAEIERACVDVANTIQSLLTDAWEWVHSDEYIRAYYEDNETGDVWRNCNYSYYKNGGYTGRVYLSDTRQYYTAAGAPIQRADIEHECVSIVKL